MNMPMEEWQKADFLQALNEEREIATNCEAAAEEMAARLDRISDHLHTLAKYANGLTPDPWPEPEVKAKRKKALTPNAALSCSRPKK